MNPTINKAIKLCFFSLLFLFRYFKYGNVITNAESEPIISREVFARSIPTPLPNTGIIYFMFLYFSVINDKLIKFTINELEISITKINIVVNFFPIIKKDGNRKNIKIYQTGVSMKKFVFIAFASTVAASSAAKKSQLSRCSIIR